MEDYFTVKGENLENLKTKIRSLGSLRFLSNPQELSNNEYRICLSGDVEDFNELNKYRYGESNKNGN